MLRKRDVSLALFFASVQKVYLCFSGKRTYRAILLSFIAIRVRRSRRLPGRALAGPLICENKHDTDNY